MVWIEEYEYDLPTYLIYVAMLLLLANLVDDKNTWIRTASQPASQT